RRWCGRRSGARRIRAASPCRSRATGYGFSIARRLVCWRKTMPADFGMIGLAVMGRNLALNVEDHGFSVAVWNREPEMTDAVLAESSGKKLVGAHALDEFVKKLARPRRIMMMIKAGAPVDEMLEKIAPLLDPGDVLIDGGNSWFLDTRRREESARRVGIQF